MQILWIAFWGAFLLFILASIIFSYHWTTYGINNKVIRSAQTVYLVGGIGLLLLTAILIKAL